MSEDVNVPAGPPEGTPPPEVEQLPAAEASEAVDDGSEDEEGLAEALDTAAVAAAGEALAADEVAEPAPDEAPAIHHQRPLTFNQGT